MKVKTKLTITGLLVFAAVITLIVSSIMAGATGLVVTISELLADPVKYEDQYLQLEGNLIETSVRYDISNVELYFEITDGNGVLPVLWYDVTPDNFEDDVEVIIYGYYSAGEPFRAERLETRCPSKYEEES
ncbi:MAG: cytochrome c maturation protein CcmE [Dethiobacter sp.]|jgi:cytochrome c-type biogenesis protein CcmE|nr:cytochrome c maturation protein CcmE [Dethiobacter sp.]